MKKTLALAIVLTLPVAFAVDLKNDTQKGSYAIGVDMGQTFKSFQTSKNKDVLDLDALFQGIKDSYEGKELALKEDELTEAMQKFAETRKQEMQEEMASLMEKSQEESKKFLEENAKKEGVKTTESGLQYKIIKEGSDVKATADDSVRVQYKGKLMDGTIFDESTKEGIEFPLASVIAGWAEGVQLIGEGGKVELYIPSELAYGEFGQPAAGIKPNSALIFEVSVEKVIKTEKKEDAKAEVKEEAKKGDGKAAPISSEEQPKAE